MSHAASPELSRPPDTKAAPNRSLISPRAKTHGAGMIPETF